MCGIFGWFGAPPADVPSYISKASHLLRHRGPDDQGFEIGAGWGLGFRRLSILDLSPQGHQPMCTSDKRFWLVFNGEIYNYLELRQELETSGERFQSTSDSEVLLRLLALQGPAGLKRLNGMFALALLDTHRRTFLLARDRLGVKPLYYTTQNGSLRFASELKALLAWPDAGRDLNRQAVAQYLALNYLPAETCIFQGYHKLLPGYYLTGALDQPLTLHNQNYWKIVLNPELDERTITDQELDEIHDLLADAVSIRLRSDVPIGIFLSGGIDSGLVANLAAKANPGNPPLALTVRFDQKEFDESELARTTAWNAGLTQQIIQLNPGNLTDIDQLAWFYDEPFGDVSALPTFHLCEKASHHATVFLGGDGGMRLLAAIDVISALRVTAGWITGLSLPPTD